MGHLTHLFSVSESERRADAFQSLPRTLTAVGEAERDQQMGRMTHPTGVIVRW